MCDSAAAVTSGDALEALQARPTLGGGRGLAGPQPGER